MFTYLIAIAAEIAKVQLISKYMPNKNIFFNNSQNTRKNSYFCNFIKQSNND